MAFYVIRNSQLFLLSALLLVTVLACHDPAHAANVTYSQSIETQFVNPSDYPATNVASFGSNLKLYWKLLKNEKSSDINNAILEFGAVALRTKGYLSFCFGYLSGDPMKGDTSKLFCYSKVLKH